MMPRYFSISGLAPELSPVMVSARMSRDAAAGDFARLGTGLFVLDPFLSSLFGQYCFDVFTEDGKTVALLMAG